MTSPAFTVTFFPNFAATTKREEILAIEELAELIRQTSKHRKNALPWLKGARFGDLRTDKRCLRNDANVIAITAIEADYDAEKISFDEAVRIITDAGLCAIVYTSPSHDEDRPRWRILCPLSAEYPAVDRDRLFARLNGLFGGIFAAESWRLAQSYYFGAIKNNPSHRVIVTEGRYLDQADNLDVTAIGKPERDKPANGNGEWQTIARPEAITDKRINGKIASLLANISNAPDGSKHRILFDMGRTLGGYLHLTNWTTEQAEAELVAALPASVKDWNLARRTARDAIRIGMTAPLMLEDRPGKQPRKRATTGNSNRENQNSGDSADGGDAGAQPPTEPPGSGGETPPPPPPPPEPEPGAGPDDDEPDAYPNCLPSRGPSRQPTPFLRSVGCPRPARVPRRRPTCLDARHNCRSRTQGRHRFQHARHGLSRRSQRSRPQGNPLPALSENRLVRAPDHLGDPARRYRMEENPSLQSLHARNKAHRRHLGTRIRSPTPSMGNSARQGTQASTTTNPKASAGRRLHPGKPASTAGKQQSRLVSRE
jgi:hypothetical protein